MKRKIVFAEKNGNIKDKLPFLDDTTYYHIENSRLLYNSKIRQSTKLNRISSYSLNNSTALSIQPNFKCDLLPGSLLEANNLFGMDIGRSSYMTEVEEFIDNGNETAKTIITNHNSNLISPNISIVIENYQIRLNGEIITERIEDNQRYDLKCLVSSISYDEENNPVLTIQFQDNCSHENIVIESDIALEFQENEKESEKIINPRSIRISSSSVYFSPPIENMKSFEIISDSCYIENKISCECAILRCNDLTIEKEFQSNNFIFIGERELNVKNSLNVSENCFISSFGKITLINFTATKAWFHCKQLIMKKICIIDDSIFAKTNEIEIMRNSTLKADMFYLETHKLTNTGTIQLSKKATMFFLYEKKNEEVFLNKNVFSTYDLFVESNHLIQSKSQTETAKLNNSSALTVKNAFLLSNGNFTSCNSSIRSLYIHSNSQFHSKKNFSIGDFLVIEENSTFISEGVNIPYSNLKPTVLNSGKFISNRLLKVNKFITDGNIERSLHLEADDLISLSSHCELDFVDITSHMIAITKKAFIKCSSAHLSAYDLDISYGSLMPIDNDSEISIETSIINDSLTNLFGSWKNKTFKEIKKKNEEINESISSSQNPFASVCTPPIKPKEY